MKYGNFLRMIPKNKEEANVEKELTEVEADKQ
jgi:hypothetical protein